MTTSSIASFVFTATQLTQNNKMTKKMQSNFSRKHLTHSKQISKVTATMKCSDIVKEVDFKDADQLRHRVLGTITRDPVVAEAGREKLYMPFYLNLTTPNE